MSFFNRIRDGFSRFMNGRHGVDQLSSVMVYTAIILDIIYLFSRWYVLSIISTVLIVIALFRMFSTNGAKRYAENMKFLQLTGNLSTGFNQWKTRRANSKEFKYFRCPQCHSMLRMPRGIGEKTVTCGKCHHQFRKKA